MTALKIVWRHDVWEPQLVPTMALKRFEKRAIMPFKYWKCGTNFSLRSSLRSRLGDDRRRLNDLTIKDHMKYCWNSSTSKHHKMTFLWSNRKNLTKSEVENLSKVLFKISVDLLKDLLEKKTISSSYKRVWISEDYKDRHIGDIPRYKC